jgi:hypothetical protein
MDALVRQTSAVEADGEAVWSWSPDAGIKRREIFSWRDGGYQARYPGESTEQPLKPLAQGRPGRSGWTCGDLKLVCFLYRMPGCGCSQHPVFPAPSDSGGTETSQSSDVLRRENDGPCFFRQMRPGRAGGNKEASIFILRCGKKILRLGTAGQLLE